MRGKFGGRCSAEASIHSVTKNSCTFTVEVQHLRRRFLEGGCANTPQAQYEREEDVEKLKSYSVPKFKKYHGRRRAGRLSASWTGLAKIGLNRSTRCSEAPQGPVLLSDVATQMKREIEERPGR